MQLFSQLVGSPQELTSGSATSDSVDGRSSLKRPHVLFLIDHLMARGGGEGNLLKVVELMPPGLVQCSVATFRINPEIQKSIRVPVHVLGLRRAYGVSGLKAARQLMGLIRREKIDIVQTYFETSNLWGGVVTKLSGAKLLSSRRDMGILRARKHRIAYRIVNRITDRVLTVSEEVRRFCISQDRLDANRVSVVYNGVDLTQVENAAEGMMAAAPDWAGAGHLVTCVANIRPIKGIDVLVRTAERVCAEIPDCVFLVVGECSPRPYVNEIRSLISSLGLEKNFRLLNFMENPLPIVKTSNVFCLLSRSEGFSNALLEAMACGIPSVATQVGGNPEAIRDGVNGFLVGPEDAVTAAEKILALLRDPNQARKIGAAARATIEDQFTSEIMIHKLVALYQDMLRAEG